MIFSVQRFLEDYFSASGNGDPDQYAVSLANLYDQRRAGASKQEFLDAMRKMRTAFFRSNRLDRVTFESSLLTRLDQRFKKKVQANPGPDVLRDFERGLDEERLVIRKAKRRTVRLILEQYRHGIESRAIDMFWKSRTQGVLKPGPESIAQGAFALLAGNALQDRGVVLREFASGIGWADVGIMVSSVLHIIELKVLRRGDLTGPEQLEQYLRNERRKEGWLLVIDARFPDRKTALPRSIPLASGRTAHVIAVDINPRVPSSA